MIRNKTGVIVFSAGVLLMLLSVFLGKVIETDLQSLGIKGYESAKGPPGMLQLLLFVFSFPLGAGLALLGGVLFARVQRGRVLALGVLLFVIVTVVVFVPVVFGTGVNPLYFGTGGVSILVLVALAWWFWGGYRGRLPEDARGAADLQALGYFCFALAAWNLCGVGGMPGFALYPERMIALESRDFAVGQLKAVMAYFVLGWVFTVAGLYRRAKRLDTAGG